MRVTNLQLTEKLLRNIKSAQSAQLEAQQQVATGQKISVPSDDGVKFGRVVKLESEKRELIQYKRNNGHAQDIINASIGNLEKIQEVNVRAMEIARIGASGVNQNSYSAYVEEIDQLLEEVVNRANASFQGNFLFAGSRIKSGDLYYHETTGSFTKTDGTAYTATDTTTDTNVKKYVSPFTITRGGTGALAELPQPFAGGILDRVNVKTSGSEYSKAPTVTILDTTGTGASATAVLNGSVKNIAVVEGGANYSNPTISIEAPAQTWMTGTSYSIGSRVFINGNVYVATSIATDSKKTSEIAGATTPSGTSTTSTVSDGNINWQYVGTGTQATAEATIVGGVITGYKITNAGSGYDTPPTITITDTTGSGASAGAEVRGVVGAIYLNSKGLSYTAKTSVSISTENQINEIKYLGDTTKAEFYIGDGSKLSAHLDPSSNAKFLTAINNLKELRNALAGDAANVPGRMRAIESNLQTYEDDVLGQLAELAGKELRLKSSTDFESQLFLQKETQISNDVDIDLAAAMVQLTRAQTAYSVALQTSSSLLSGSLLDYL